MTGAVPGGGEIQDEIDHIRRIRHMMDSGRSPTDTSIRDGRPGCARKSPMNVRGCHNPTDQKEDTKHRKSSEMCLCKDRLGHKVTGEEERNAGRTCEADAGDDRHQRACRVLFYSITAIGKSRWK